MRGDDDSAGSRSSPSAYTGSGFIQIANVVEHCLVLGPGDRFVVWSQGCTLACPGCMSPHTHDPGDGSRTSIATLAARIIDTALDGITLSGGEPFQQAAEFSDLLDRVRTHRPELTVMCFSGYRIEELLTQDHRVRGLLMRLDCLVDGRFDVSRTLDPPLRWRGSSNQRPLLLTDRVASWAAAFEARGVWLEFEVAEDATDWRGIPPPKFFPRFKQASAAHGVDTGHDFGKPPVVRLGGTVT